MPPFERCTRSQANATELQVGDSPLLTSAVMPAVLRAYQKAMPQVKVKGHDWQVEKDIAGVRDGRLHLAIILPPLKANALDALRFQRLFTARVCLAVSRDHPSDAPIATVILLMSWLLPDNLS